MPLLFAASLFAQVAEGDRHWTQRGEGAVGGRAKAAHVDAAIAAYQRAAQANRNDLEARWKLLRALRFKGAYVAASNEEKKRIYSQAKTAGDEALAVLAARGVNLKGKEAEIAKAARAINGAAEIFLWDAVNWGEWALAYGKLAAARQGAADRIRREATIAMLMSPTLEGGAPSRVLGRLHDQTPRIPLVTGWASQKDALRFLSDSLKIAPANKLSLVFYAEALPENQRAEAMRVLRRVVSAANDPEFPVEDAAATEDAQRLLRAWGD